MKALARASFVVTLGVAAVVAVRAADTKVDLSKETVGKTPTTFEPIVGTWVVAQDGSDKVIKVDGSPWKAAQSAPAQLLTAQAAGKLYGSVRNEELMDNAKQFAYYPVAVLKNFDNFTDGTISLKFKTIAGDADRASGILFNVKPDGSWLAVRYNDTENNVAMWTFHGDGIRRNLKFSDRAKPFPLDRAAWHELKLVVSGADTKTYLDGQLALEYTLGVEPQPGRRGAPNPFLFPTNNPTLQPPVKGKVGLWAKTDSTSLFKDYVISSK